MRCDDSLFKFPYNPIYAGRAIKLKFVAYNSYNEGQQDLATVTAYDFTLAGTAWDASASQWDAGATLWTS